MLLSNCQIPDGDETVSADIYVADGKIAHIGKLKNVGKVKETLDMDGKLVLPGCIDSHTLYGSGFTHRETFSTGTQSAAAGGVTTIIDMPCCSIPSVRDIPVWKTSWRKSLPRHMDFALWG